MYGERRGWEIGEPSVNVEYDAESVPRRFEIAVHLPDGLSAEQLRRLEQVAETCPLRRALEGGFIFEERFVVPPTPRPLEGSNATR